MMMCSHETSAWRAMAAAVRAKVPAAFRAGVMTETVGLSISGPFAGIAALVTAAG
jgi:hypothetical protein